MTTKKIRLDEEPFYRVYKKTKGRKDYSCHCCQTKIPKGEESFVIYLHPGTGRACKQCVVVFEVRRIQKQLFHEYSPNPYVWSDKLVKIEEE